MNFERENNWDDAPGYLRAGVVWKVAPPNGEHLVYETYQGAQHWVIRMNDFPEEPLYTLLADGHEIIHFSDWPAEWGERPTR